MIMPSKKAGGNEQMHLHHRPFQWLCGGVEAVHAASPNAAWPGLLYYWLRIALAAARATANKTKMQNESTLLTISMAVAVRWYYTTHIAQWSRSMAFIKATKRRHWVSTVPTVVAMVAWAAAAATVAVVADRCLCLFCCPFLVDCCLHLLVPLFPC
jgi:hypothetical protein